MELLLPAGDGGPSPSALLWERLKIYCAQTGWCEEWRDVATPVQSSSAQTVVLPGIGLVALQPWVTPGILKAALAGAQAFVAEWRELRAVHAARLADAILGLPLSEVSCGAGFGMRWKGFSLNPHRTTSGVSALCLLTLVRC